MLRKIWVTAIVVCIYSASVAQENFKKNEVEIIEHAQQTDKLRILLTNNYEDSLKLRQKAVAINFKDKRLPKLYKLMLNTVKDTANSGVGLAAPQVGIIKRLFIIQRFDKPNEPFEFILNPTINWHSNLVQNGREGCLSIPDTLGMVDRHYAIQVTYQTIQGQWITETLEGFTAIIFQHEYDHLDGILFLDRLDEQATKNYYPSKQNFNYLEDKNVR